jgi:hypothetical protein
MSVKASSDSAICDHAGAALTDPVPVWLRYFFVVEVFPTSRFQTVDEKA